MSKMNKIQLYNALLAIACGALSNQYHFQNVISIGVPILLYIGFVFFISGYMKKKPKKVIADTLVTFLLVWFVVWTILFNATSFL